MLHKSPYKPFEHELQVPEFISHDPSPPQYVEHVSLQCFRKNPLLHTPSEHSPLVTSHLPLPRQLEQFIWHWEPNLPALHSPQLVIEPHVTQFSGHRLEQFLPYQPSRHLVQSLESTHEMQFSLQAELHFSP